MSGISQKSVFFNDVKFASSVTVFLFCCSCAPAAEMLQSNGDVKRKWTWAVEWLNDELERRPYPGNAQYTYNNWSPPTQSNETSNG